MADGGPISCRNISPDVVRKHMSKYVRKRHRKNWAIGHDGNEMDDDCRSSQWRPFIKKKCTTLTKNHAHLAGSSVADGAVPQERIFGCGWTKDDMCGDLGPEVHRLFF